MALRVAVVVSHAPWAGREAVQRPSLHRGRERIGRGFLGDVEVTEPPSQVGNHPCPLFVVRLRDRVLDVDLVHSPRNGRTSTFRLHAFSPFGGELERHVEVGGFDDPEPGDPFLRLHVGPVRDQHLVARWSMTVAVSGDPRPFA